MKFVLLFLMSVQFTWALSDRALFSNGDNVYFVSDANNIMRVFKNGFCKANLEYVNYVLKFPKIFKELGTSNQDYSLEERDSISHLLIFSKLSNLAKSEAVSKQERRSIKRCAIGARLQKLKKQEGLISNVIRVEKYLRARVITKKKNGGTKREYVQEYIRNFVLKINHKEFF